ncbi:D-arabinono-1,4-lactone oxidase [Angustibacter aerolatus]
MAARTWTNWARTETAHPVRVVTPRSVDDVAQVVTTAAAAGLRVKPVGAGHSFTGVAVTDGVQVRPEGLATRFDVVGPTTVTVGAGWRLHDLTRELERHGLAMANLGDVDVQTLSGAVATGTHGTGAALGGLASQVRGLELVLADGTVATCGPGEPLFEAARLGLGAVGVVTALTLEVVPAFALRAHEGPGRLPDVLDGWLEHATAHDHFEFYWFPHTDRVLLKQHDRVPPGTPLEPLSPRRAWVDDELLSNRVFEAVNRLAAGMPRLVPALNAVSARALTAREHVDASYRVLASQRSVVFRETEWGFPRAAVPDVVRAIDAWVRRSHEHVPFPVEVRVGAADDPWLSTAHGRDTGWVAVHQYHRMPHQRYFAAVAAIAAEHGGRPHWGKLHPLGAEQLRTLYPRFDDAVAVRDRVDPAGVFANPYLDRVLGRTPDRVDRAARTAG